MQLLGGERQCERGAQYRQPGQPGVEIAERGREQTMITKGAVDREH
ncbi:MAG: hypothetical protein ACLQF4_00525 [Xanthobacteraceae bacterium]